MAKKVDVRKIPKEYLHPACHDCILQNTVKKDIKNPDTGKVIFKKGDFPIECKGILNEQGYKHMAQQARLKRDVPLSNTEGLKEEIHILRMAFDKAYWAAQELGRELRKTNEEWGEFPYQEVILNCTAKRKALRLGRRSGKTEIMAIDALHSSQTSAKVKGLQKRIGSTVTFITPADTQRKEIFDRIRSFMYDTMALEKGPDIKKDSNTPYPEVKTTENAVIQGFVTGTSSSSDGTSIRGKGGDKNFWDEAAFIKPAHYAIMMPLLAEDKDVDLTVSSTPMTEEGNFYEFCVDPVFKEFHFPTVAMPFWTDQIAYDQRKHLGPIRYRQEILAEFGSVDESVFSEELRDSMFVGQDYSDIQELYLTDRDSYYIGMGVDWNGVQNGNQIALMAMPKKGGQKVIIHRESITGENLQTRSLQIIRDLNRKWMPDFLYFDNGFGHTQIELLHGIALQAFKRYGRGHHDVNLKNIRGVNFQGRMKLKDPLTKKDVNVAVKPFMVDTLILEMEESNIIASADDDVLNDQMRSYQLVKITENGTPKYGPGSKTVGDHALDAVMLCAFGFRVEYGEIDVSSVFGAPVTVDPYSDLGILLEPDNYESDRSAGLHKRRKSSNIKESLRPQDRAATISDRSILRDVDDNRVIKKPSRSRFDNIRTVNLRRRY
jgi:hypothetical protein